MKRTHVSVIPGSYLRNLVIKCMLIFVTGLVVLAGVFYLTNQQTIGPTYGEGFKILSELQQDILYKSLILYLCIVLVMVVGVIGITLLYSHRVVGPIYRLSIFAGEIKDGHFEKSVSLREGDAIHSLAREMNNMVAQCRQTIQLINFELVEITKQKEMLRNGQDKDAVLSEISSRAGEISRILSTYQM